MNLLKQPVGTADIFMTGLHALSTRSAGFNNCDLLGVQTTTRKLCATAMAVHHLHACVAFVAGHLSDAVVQGFKSSAAMHQLRISCAEQLEQSGLTSLLPKPNISKRVSEGAFACTTAIRMHVAQLELLDVSSAI